MTKYTLIDKMAKNGMAVLRLNEGPYEGVQFYFGETRFIESKDSSECKLEFDFGVVEAVEYNAEELEKSEEFQQIAGDILIGLIEEHAKTYESNSK